MKKLSNSTKALIDTITVFLVAGVILCFAGTEWYGAVAYVLWTVIVIVKPNLASSALEWLHYIIIRKQVRD